MLNSGFLFLPECAVEPNVKTSEDKESTFMLIYVPTVCSAAGEFKMSSSAKQEAVNSLIYTSNVCVCVCMCVYVCVHAQDVVESGTMHLVGRTRRWVR